MSGKFSNMTLEQRVSFVNLLCQYLKIEGCWAKYELSRLSSALARSRGYEDKICVVLPEPGVWMQVGNDTPDPVVLGYFTVHQFLRFVSLGKRSQEKAYLRAIRLDRGDNIPDYDHMYKDGDPIQEMAARKDSENRCKTCKCNPCTCSTYDEESKWESQLEPEPEWVSQPGMRNLYPQEEITDYQNHYNEEG